MSIQGLRLATYKVSSHITEIFVIWMSWFLPCMIIFVAFLGVADVPRVVLLTSVTAFSGLIMISYSVAVSAALLMLLCLILTPFVPKEQRVLLRLGEQTIWALNLPKPQRKMAKAMRKIIEKEFRVGVSFMTFLGNGDAILLIDTQGNVLDVDALAERLQLDAHVHDTLSGLLYLELSPYLEIESTRIRLIGIPVDAEAVLPGRPVYNLQAEST